jgi:hypothetical protein
VARVRVHGTGGQGAGERERTRGRAVTPVVVERSGARGGRMTRGCGAAAGKERGKGRRGGWSALARSGRRGEEVRSGGRGKLTGGTCLSAAPGESEDEASRQIATVGWAGRAGWFACGERKGKGEEGSWAWVGRWAGGPLGVLENRFLDLNLIAPFKFKFHTI